MLAHFHLVEQNLELGLGEVAFFDSVHGAR